MGTKISMALINFDSFENNKILRQLTKNFKTFWIIIFHKPQIISILEILAMNFLELNT